MINDVKKDFDDTFSLDVYKHFGMTRRANEFSKYLQYSDRDPESVSNRSLLANALDSVVQDESEKRRLEEYREAIGKLEGYEKELAELKA